MWKNFERGLSVVGSVAAIISAIVAIYILLVPSELSRFVSKFDTDPVEASTINSVYQLGSKLTAVSVIVGRAEGPQPVEVVLCDLGSSVMLGSYRHVFERDGGGVHAEFPRVEEKVRVLLAFEANGSHYVRAENWGLVSLTSTSWVRLDPSIVSKDMLLEC